MSDTITTILVVSGVCLLIYGIVRGCVVFIHKTIKSLRNSNTEIPAAQNSEVEKDTDIGFWKSLIAGGVLATIISLMSQESAMAMNMGYPVGRNCWRNAAGDWVPLYEGKMVQAFDHRAANVIINPENQHRPAQPEPATFEQHQNPDWMPNPQYWVLSSECNWPASTKWVLGFKEITAPTNLRTFIAALLPSVGFGNKIPLFLPEGDERKEFLLAANMNSIVFDFVTRQKVQGQTLNLFIVEQLPVVPPDHYCADLEHYRA